MRLILIFIGFVSLPFFSAANGGVDTIILGIQNAEDSEKLELWSKWIKNPTKDNIDGLKNSLNKAFDDAEKIVGRDSAVIWYFKKQASLAHKLRTFGKSKDGLKLIEKMKITADSISAVQGEPHALLVYYYINIGRYYYNQVNMKEAEAFYRKGLEINKSVKRIDLDFSLYNKLGAIFSYLKDFDQAKENYSKAESIADHPSVSTKRKYNFYYIKAYMHAQQGEQELSNQLFEKVLDSIHIFSKTIAFRIQTEYASNLCEMGRVNECASYLERLKPVFEIEGTNETMLTFSEEYTDALILSGRFEEAKEWAEKTRDYYYKIQEERRDDEVQEWQAKYKADEKSAQIKLLEQDKVLLENEKSLARNQLLIISLVALFSLGLLAFFIYRNKNRRKLIATQIEKDRQIAENRDRLFSSITHDIRTPLALMLAPLERAESSVKDPASKADINLARRNGKRLMELFNQILDWNKAEAKALRLNPQVGQLDITFNSLLERYEQQAAEKEVIFTHKIKVPSEQFLLDYDKLDKILSNLVGNAIKFCDQGQGVQLIADYQEIDDQPALILAVKDQGPGISEDEQKTLFKRYVQGAQGKLKGGTGIGLALVKELVDMMSGKIELKSTLGKGTTFNLNIPIKVVEELPIEEFGLENDFTPKRNPITGEKHLILVVEDEPELLEFLRSALSNDYNVEIANSTTTGLNVAINRIPEIIISDWTLPDNNGGWLCRQIANNELTAHIPVMILTAHNNATNQKLAFDSGAVAWMNKPFQLDTLKRQLQTILMQQQRVQNLWAKKSQPENITDKQVEQVETVDPFMQKVIDAIENNYQEEDFSVEKMAESLFLSRVQLFRKIKSITGGSPSKMITEFRLQRARKLLQESGKSVSEVTFEVGFSDPSYFGKAYKQFFSVSPSQDLGNR